MRQVFIDTETTGLHSDMGDRIIEIGAIEIEGRERTGRNFHHYLQPDRPIDAGATEVHGIRDEDLLDCPRFTEVSGELVDFLRGAELIAHNAPFDIAFLNAELGRLDDSPCESVKDVCKVFDTLAFARRKHPGARNSLDDLCQRYKVDNSDRGFHGALKDANLLADVYLAMTGGQMGLFGGQNVAASTSTELASVEDGQPRKAGLKLNVRYANADELSAHEAFLREIDDMCSEGSLWRRLTSAQLPNIQPAQAG